MVHASGESQSIESESEKFTTFFSQAGTSGFWCRLLEVTVPPFFLLVEKKLIWGVGGVMCGEKMGWKLRRCDDEVMSLLWVFSFFSCVCWHERADY